MYAYQYVHADVPSGYFFYWIFHYTHHIYTDTHQYVNFDVPLVHSSYWIFYYTHHSCMYIHQYVQGDVSSDIVSP